MCINICIHIYVYEYIYAYTYIYMRMSAKVTKWHKRPLRSRYARAYQEPRFPPHRHTIGCTDTPFAHTCTEVTYTKGKGQRAIVCRQPANME